MKSSRTLSTHRWKTMKSCSRCKVNKDESLFYVDRRSKNGLYSACKVCIRKMEIKNGRSKTYDYKGYRLKYKRTEEGYKRIIFLAMKARVRNRDSYKNFKADFNFQQFSEFLKTTDFKKIWDVYVKSGFLKKLQPSVDRINTYEGYTFPNMRILTLQQNLRRAKRSPFAWVVRDSSIKMELSS